MRPRYKIVGEVEEFICTQHAQSVPPYRIAKQLHEKGIKIDPSSIWDFLNNAVNFDTIHRYIEKWRADPMTIDIANKKVRLHDMNETRKALLATMNRMVTKEGEIYEKKIGKYLNIAKRLIEIEIAARDEIEKKPDLLAYFERIGPYKDLTDEELKREDRRITEKLLLIRSGATPKTESPAIPGA